MEIKFNLEPCEITYTNFCFIFKPSNLEKINNFFTSFIAYFGKGNIQEGKHAFTNSKLCDKKLVEQAGKKASYNKGILIYSKFLTPIILKIYLRQDIL